jgi:hypothetical protein
VGSEDEREIDREIQSQVPAPEEWVDPSANRPLQLWTHKHHIQGVLTLWRVSGLWDNIIEILTEI